MPRPIAPLLCLLLAPLVVRADPPPSPAPGEAPTAEAAADAAVPDLTVLDEVLVSGEQPGPGLWRIARATPEGENVLWILGNYGPLPKKMQWNPAKVEQVIAQSQEVLGPTSVNANVGVFTGLTLLPSLVGIRNNPDGQTLQQVVPAELYARWLPLKKQYLGNDRGVEKWRPVFAAGELYEEAISDTGLERENKVWPVIEKAAKKHKVKVTRPSIAVPIEKPRDMIKEFKKAEFADLECFQKTLERLESDLDLMRVRANAWATGDVKTLRELAPVDQAGACLAVVTESQFLQSRGLADLPERLTAAWLAAAEEALARNQVSFGVLWMGQLLRDNGVLAQLQARGYRVDGP